MTIKVSGEVYVLCAKCGVFRKPDAFKVKKQTRKSCGSCRSKK